MAYTVKQISDLAGVSPRTLHYYDQIGLLRPANYGDNGYRYYEEKSLLRLQQILFFKELGFSLEDILKIIDRPDFDVLEALQLHRTALQKRAARLKKLIHTVDQTMLHLKGKVKMSEDSLFEGFSEEKQQDYVKEMQGRYGEVVQASVKKWTKLSPRQMKVIQAEGEAIYRGLLANMAKGPQSTEVQGLIGRWHQHLRYFYEPTSEILRGLADLYNEHPDFLKTFRKMHPDLPVFLRRAIVYYCDHGLAEAGPARNETSP